MKVAGKVWELEKSLTTFRRAIDRSGISIELNEPLNTLKDLWSVHLTCNDLDGVYTNGKGVTSDTAIASALGEFFERMTNLQFFNNFFVGKNKLGFHYFKDEVAIPKNKVDPYFIKTYLDGEKLYDAFLDFGSGSDDVICLPFVDILTGKEKLVPINVLHNLYASNGMSAGNTREEALVQAISETIERHVKFLIIENGYALPDIPCEYYEQNKVAREAIAKLEESGYTVLIKDASLERGYPVVNVTLVDRQNGSVYASFGCHPNFYVALERTLTELAQGRKISDLNVFGHPTFNLDLAASPENLEQHFIDSDGKIHWNFILDEPDFTFAPWDCPDEISSELEQLLEILQNEEEPLKVLVYEAQTLSIPTVRVIIPGFSEVYPMDDLIENNCNLGRALQEYMMNIHNLEDEDLVNLQNSLSILGSNLDVTVAKFIGLIPDESSGWDTLSLLDLAVLVDFALRDVEHLEEVLSMYEMFKPVPRIYQCAYAILRESKYLEGLFTSDLILEATNLLNGPFTGLAELGENFQNVKNHQRMLRLYHLAQGIRD